MRELALGGELSLVGFRRQTSAGRPGYPNRGLAAGGGHQERGDLGDERAGEADRVTAQGGGNAIGVAQAA